MLYIDIVNEMYELKLYLKLITNSNGMTGASLTIIILSRPQKKTIN